MSHRRVGSHADPEYKSLPLDAWPQGKGTWHAQACNPCRALGLAVVPCHAAQRPLAGRASSLRGFVQISHAAYHSDAWYGWQRNVPCSRRVSHALLLGVVRLSPLKLKHCRQAHLPVPSPELSGRFNRPCAVCSRGPVELRCLIRFV